MVKDSYPFILLVIISVLLGGVLIGQTTMCVASGGNYQGLNTCWFFSNHTFEYDECCGRNIPVSDMADLHEQYQVFDNYTFKVIE